MDLANKDKANSPGVLYFHNKFATEPRDLLIASFGGSNTTSKAAQILQREWISIEPDMKYIKGLIGRITNLLLLIRSNYV